MAARAEEEPPAAAAAASLTARDGASDPAPDPPESYLLLLLPADKERVDEEPREAKRRRTCPAALDTTPAAATATSTTATAPDEDGYGPSGGGSGHGAGFSFSFSFDTKGMSQIETTPKFGSFHFLETQETATETEAASGPADPGSEASPEASAEGNGGEVEEGENAVRGGIGN